MPDVALATCRHLPEHDPDAEPLARALAGAGLSSELRAWDDPGARWSDARLTVLRSTWNYPERPREFLDWAASVAAVCELWNPLPVVRWNLHKSYLLALERLGVPVVPTELARKGSERPLEEIASCRGWTAGDVVIKPAVSAASYRTLRARPGSDRAREHFHALVRDADVLVQAYLPSVEDYGERALVWVDGEITHAVRKSPRFEGEHERVSAVAVGAEEAELGERALRAVRSELGVSLLYGRIDVAPGLDGALCVMELELLEPSLYFSQGPQALERFVRGLERRLRRQGADGERPEM